MTDINKPVNLNEMIKSIIMRIKLIRCIELKAIVTLSLVLINSGNLLIGSNLFIRDNNDLSADTILRYNNYPTGKFQGPNESEFSGCYFLFWWRLEFRFS